MNVVKRVFRRRDVCEMYGISGATLYRLIGAGKFPRPIKIGLSAVGWDADELNAWYAERKSANAGGEA